MEEPEVSCLQKCMWECLNKLKGFRNNCDLFLLLYRKWNYNLEFQQRLDSPVGFLQSHKATYKSGSGSADSLVVRTRLSLLAEAFA